MTRTLSTLVALAALATAAHGQTPPQKPNVTPIPATPPLVLPGPPEANDASVKPLSADDAALIALRLQPNVTLAFAQAQSARAQVTEALAGLLPTMSLSSGYDWVGVLVPKHSSSTSSVTLGGASQWSSSVTVHQLLFDFMRTMDAVRQARATAKAADYNLTAVQANLIFQVKQQFYTTAEDLSLVNVYVAEVKSDQDSLDLTVAELSSGLGVPSDVVTAAANLANATSSLVQARATYLIARATLAALIGVDPRTPIVLANTTEPTNTSTDFNAMVDAGLRNRPEILQAEESLRAAGYGVSFARKALLPSIGLSATGSASGQSNPFATNVGVLGISLSWTLYDGGLNAGQVEAANASALTAKANLVAETQSVVNDVSSAYIGLQSAQQRVAIAASAVANAEQGLRLSQGRFQAGVTTFVEVTQATATLVTAQASQAIAQGDLQIALAQLARSIGASIHPPRPDELKPIQPSSGAK